MTTGTAAAHLWSDSAGWCTLKFYQPITKLCSFPAPVITYILLLCTCEATMPIYTTLISLSPSCVHFQQLLSLTIPLHGFSRLFMLPCLRVLKRPFKPASCNRWTPISVNRSRIMYISTNKSYLFSFYLFIFHNCYEPISLASSIISPYKLVLVLYAVKGLSLCLPSSLI